MLPDSPSPHNVTRADVARYAGVSSAVVSYVVNDGPRPVAAATASRVREAIRILQYRPNASARALRSGSTRLLGLVVPELENPVFANIVLAVEEHAGARGFAVLVTNTESNAEREKRNVASLVSRQVDGLILASIVSRPDLLGHAMNGIPTVLISDHGEIPGFPTVGINTDDGAHLGVSHLADHGFDKIGLIIGDLPTGGVEPRELGWLRATREAGLEDGPIARGPFSRTGGYEAGLRMFSAKNPPRAVFVSSDLQAMGLMRALYELGLTVPSDVAVVCFDGTEEVEFARPGLTAVEQPIRALAVDAVERVLAPPAEQLRFFSHMPTLTIRHSCGCEPGIGS